MASSLGRPRRPDDKPAKPDKPATTTPAGPGGPAATVGLGAPQGKIRALGDGTRWSAANQWDDLTAKAAAEAGVPASRVKAHIVVESRGDPGAVQRNPQGASYGLMQVVPRWWRSEIGRLAGRSYATDEDAGQAMMADPLLAIRAGCRVLQVFRDDYDETWDQASSRFFLGNPNWQGGDTENGTSGQDYKRLLDALIAEIDAAPPAGAGGATGTTPAPVPQPAADPLVTILGGPVPRIDYGFGDDVGLHYYAYFDAAHGNPRGNIDTAHPGLDIPVPVGTVLHSPGPGVVTCAGTNVGAGSWGTSCAAFADTLNGGAGRVEIMLDTGVSVILGHCLSSLVKVGQRVTTGQPVAKSSGMNGPHVHLECRVWHDADHCPRSPDYCLIDPRKALAGLGGPVQRRFPTAPDWLSDAQIAASLPDARPDGARTLAWIERCKKGKCPRFVSWWHEDTPEELGEFSEGSLLGVDARWGGEG